MRWKAPDDQGRSDSTAPSCSSKWAHGLGSGKTCVIVYEHTNHDQSHAGQQNENQPDRNCRHLCFLLEFKPATGACP